ncbi:MAG: hypothetical protein JO189_02925 [Deltaproteobacteria bacterium]|nr:hypothetical protein [Deltaproteobacteria bacterium]
MNRKWKLIRVPRYLWIVAVCAVVLFVYLLTNRHERLTQQDIAQEPTNLNNCMQHLSSLDAKERAECVRFWNSHGWDYQAEAKKLQDLGAPIR